MYVLHPLIELHHAASQTCLRVVIRRGVLHFSGSWVASLEHAVRDAVREAAEVEFGEEGRDDVDFVFAA